MRFLRGKLSALGDTWIQPGIGNEGFGIPKTSYIPDLTEKYSGKYFADTTDGSQIIGNRIKIHFNFSVKLLLLSFQVRNLPGEELDLQSIRFLSKWESERVLGNPDDFFCLFAPIPFATAFLQQCRDCIDPGGSDCFRAGVGLQ